VPCHRRNTPQPTIINIVGPGWKSTLPAEVGQVIQATLPQGFTLMRS
jgi:hypothetical protein